MPDESKKKRTVKRKVAASSEAVIDPAVSAALPPLPSRVKMHDLWEMRLAQQEKLTAEAEQRAALLLAQTHRISRLYVLAKLDPKGAILGYEQKEREAKELEAAAAKRVEAAENKALIAKRRMEATLGRPMRNVGIDMNTGEVISPEQE